MLTSCKIVTERSLVYSVLYNTLCLKYEQRFYVFKGVEMFFPGKKLVVTFYKPLKFSVSSVAQHSSGSVENRMRWTTVLQSSCMF